MGNCIGSGQDTATYNQTALNVCNGLLIFILIVFLLHFLEDNC